MPARNSLRDKNKKLTDFFNRGPSASVPPLARPPSPTGTTRMRSTARKKPMTRASKVAADHEPSRSSSAPPHMRSASIIGTRKRPRSPHSNDPSTSLPPPKTKTPRKPECAKVVLPTTPPFSLTRRLMPAEAHNDVPVASPLDSSKQVVYSSQSDEAELVLPVAQSCDLGKVAETVHAWRRKTGSLNSTPPREREDAMEVDPLTSTHIRSWPLTSTWSASPHSDPPLRSAVVSKSSPALQTPIVVSACLPSPPDTNKFAPLPPTPKPIDLEAKAAELIAEIRARAFAASRSSGDEQPLAFRELEDSDDGDLVDDLPLIGNAKGKGPLFSAPRLASDVFSSSLSSVPSTIGDAIVGLRTGRVSDRSSPLLRPIRASTRTRKLVPSVCLPPTIAESSNPLGVTKSVTFPLNHKKLQVANPFRALLREKELEDKRGTSSAAVRLAEEAARQSSREASAGSEDESDAIKRLRLADEQAAWRAVHDSRKSISPDDHDEENFTIGDRESRMLGAAAGKAINKILAGDKDSKGKERVQDVDENLTLGVSLWIQHSDEDMEVDFIPIPPLSGHPILACLDGFLKRDGDSRFDLLLRAGALASVPRDILLCNIPQLLNIALFAPSQVADAVALAFRDLWALDAPKLQMPFAAILSTLVRLGASPSVLERLGLITEDAQENHITRKNLSKALGRLFPIVKAASFAGAFDDVTNVVLILVIMGLDPLISSGELRTQLSVTMDVVCNYGATDYLLHDIHEKVLNFASQLAPVNKARLVSVFAYGSGRTRSIARHLAYCLLVSAPITPTDQAPPLDPLILLLSPDVGSCELFDVTNGSTDYEDVGHYIDMLSVALADIAPYVKEEKSASSTPVEGSPSKSKKQAAAPLELLRRVLEALQSKIVDTRAAHLNRSRTKATIQRLAMRIHYERMALLGVRPRQQTATLEAYFSPQRQ